MRRYNAILIGFAILFLIGCGSKEREPIVKTGTANQPVNLEVIAEDAQAQTMIEWSFGELPANVSLSQYDFQPINTSPQVSFIPPDSGTYHVSYAVQKQNGEVIAIQPFVIQVSPKPQKNMAEEMEDTTAAEPSTEEAEPMEEATTPEPPAEPKAQPKTTQKQTTQPSGSDRADLIPRVPGRYTVQVSAWKTFSKAESVANSVKKLGYDAYIQRAKFPDTGEVWYRVRIGSFTTYAAAKVLRNKLIEEPSLPNSTIWIDFQRKDT